jgi:hypothetical protein
VTKLTLKGDRESMKIDPAGIMGTMNKDTAMWVHLFRLIGSLWISTEATLWLHGVLIARTATSSLRDSPLKTLWKVIFFQQSLLSL